MTMHAFSSRVICKSSFLLYNVLQDFDVNNCGQIYGKARTQRPLHALLDLRSTALITLWKSSFYSAATQIHLHFFSAPVPNGKRRPSSLSLLKSIRTTAFFFDPSR